MGIREVRNAAAMGCVAERKSRMRGKGLEHEGLVKNTVVGSSSRKVLIDLYDRPLNYYKVRAGDKDLRLTTGSYCIIYYGYGSKNSLKGHPFWVANDLVDAPFKISGPEMFHALAKEVPEVAWMIRNTTYSDELFNIAASCRMIPIHFCLDFSKYKNMLLEKGDKSKNPFASRCLPEKYHNVYNGVVIDNAMPRTEFMEHMNNVAKDPKVKYEMENEIYEEY